MLRAALAMAFLARRALSLSATAPKKVVTLGRGKSKLFRKGNPLIFAGAVSSTAGNPQRGDVVDVVDGANQNVGWGTYNPDSMYRALLGAAASRRRALDLPRADTDVFRFVNSEGDGLSGLTVDAFGDVLVCQISAVWLESRRAVVEAALLEAYEDLTGISDAKVLWRRAEARLRQDGWDGEADELASGDRYAAKEGGLAYEVDVFGQKTGFYCDQRDNRAFLGPLCAGKSVLDLYCYSGRFERRSTARPSAASTRRRRPWTSRGATRRPTGWTRAPSRRRTCPRGSRPAARCGVVVCDPPKLAPSAKTLPRATRKYQKINALALGAVKRGGLLLTCTCSSAMTTSGNFLGVVHDALDAGRQVTVLGPPRAADHRSPGLRRGAYLTAVLLHVH
ncbi:S-adenosylmethionine-dependent methyltransferase [Aureococcus anophagefferens]|nr:S-adenosylmethionine-dependent methyltransferase [Aureococcus anophagefferens]